MNRLSRRLLTIADDEVRFERRKFRGGTPEIRRHIEEIGISFLAGYHDALETDGPSHLVPRLETVARPYRGFAYEGAAMALTVLDAMTPWRRDRLAGFLADRGGDHVYMAHVGAGWAIARLPFGRGGILRRLDPLLRWLAFDGYGFHQGYFHWPKAVAGRQEVPRRLRGYARRAFDQGLGRSLWFLEGADVEIIPQTIATFSEARRGDLWSGVGLAATYAGGVEVDALRFLRAAAGGFAADLAQGSAFAAKARLRAGNDSPHQDMACSVFCGMAAAQAAELTDRARADLSEDSAELPAFEIWRRRIRQRLRQPAAPSRRSLGARSRVQEGRPELASAFAG